jgi:tetratricopeptide (TPR) repeat protein
MTNSATPSEIPDLQTQYQQFIDGVIVKTLKGEFRSKEQVYQLLVKQLSLGTGEILERSLANQANAFKQQLAIETSEIKQAKLTRQTNALKTLQEAWERWQRENGTQQTCKAIVDRLLNAEPDERLITLIQALDSNQTDLFDRPHLECLAQLLNTAAANEEGGEDDKIAFEFRQFATGLNAGLAAYTKLEGDLVSWLYNREQGIGFGSSTGNEPWRTWATKTTSILPQALFAGQAQNASAATIALAQRSIDISAWVELIILLRSLQIGLVAWFDVQPYDFQAGRNMAGSTFMMFAGIWMELSNGFRSSTTLPETDRQNFGQINFQITLQTLRTFAQRDNFPLYGGTFASFGNDSLRDTLQYLDQPLKEVEQTQEKARILTVLGYSQRALNQLDRSRELHQEALTLANDVSDQRCAIANLCHLSRLFLIEKDYEQAVSYAQRALIQSRQIGDSQGQANAFASLGYGEVMQIQRQSIATPENLEASIGYLQKSYKLSETLKDWQSQACAAVGLGLADIALEQFAPAKQILEQALVLIREAGDRDLQAISYAALGEVCYQLGQLEIAVNYACLGLFLLEQRGNPAWQQTAALLSILQGQLGNEKFIQVREQQRSALLKSIGQDGVDHITALIDRYRQGG